MTIRGLRASTQFKSRLRDGSDPLVGAQIGLGDPTVVEIFGAAGFDWVLLDCEHAPRHLPGVVEMLRAAAAWPMVPFVRLSASHAESLPVLLDQGFTAIVAPFVESASQAENLIAACKYPPHGQRSWGVRRAADFGTAAVEYFETWNDALIVVVIIESRKGIENCREILSVEGVDGVLIGPMDLSLSLGAWGEFSSSEYVDAVERVRLTAAELGKGFGSSAYDPRSRQTGTAAPGNLLLVAGDEPLLMEAAREVMRGIARGRRDA